MIAASAVLVVAAMALLGVGLFQSGSTMIIASIASSILSGIFLVTGTLRERKRGEPAPAMVGFGARGEPALEETPGPVILDEAPVATEAPAYGEAAQVFDMEEPVVLTPDLEEEEEMVVAAPSARTARKATGKKAPKKAGPKKAGPKKAAPKKAGPKKAGPKKATAAAPKKTAARAAPKKTAKRPAKTAVKKAAPRKPAPRKPAPRRARSEELPEPPPPEALE